MAIGAPGTSSLHAYAPPATTSAVATQTIATTLRTTRVCAHRLSARCLNGGGAALRLEERSHHPELWRGLRGLVARKRQPQVRPSYDRPLSEEVRVESGIRERPDPALDAFFGRHAP